MDVQFPDSWKSLRTVLVHDWLTGMRGGERCLELLCRGFPQSQLCTLVCKPDQISETIRSRPVTTSVLQRLPFGRDRFRMFLPFFPEIIGSMKAPESDLQISTSHCVAKGLRPAPGARHLCYCFTPMRYDIFYDEYFGTNPAKKLVVKPVLRRLRTWDRRASDRVHRFVAISEHVRKRIRRFYDRDADVVYPPVDTERYTPSEDRRGDFDLIVSALVPYKRVDLAVRAYTALGHPLKVVGTGSEADTLRRLAGPNIEFSGYLADEEIADLYANCRFLLFPGEEDFGIVPLEAQACGTPVIAYGKGGVLETLVDGETAVFFHDQTEQALVGAVEESAALSWDRDRIRANAGRFSVQNYIDGLAQSIDACLTGSA